MKQQKLPDITSDFAEWYNEVVYAAELADLAPVRGCMVIRPYGYAIWELIQKQVDTRIKETGHHNAAFPLLIPESFLRREATHVKGFAPELAVVTHGGGKELEEPLVVRPTSETIIHYMFARWIRSWRDLPLKINQWCSVVRWEMRTRPFLRTTEFWWQEGHTAHETAAEAHAEMLLMLDIYRELAEQYLAIPVITGKKSDSERFAGADCTMTIEGLMPDGKALQMGTSHTISQNFARVFDMKFQDRAGGESYPHLTSWGMTTRLIGAMIMTHGDQKGLILPPKVAPYQIVIIPIFKTDADSAVLLEKVQDIAQELKKAGIRVQVDSDTQQTPGAKFYHWELRGVPFRIEVGPRDLANNSVVLVNRLNGTKEVIGLHELAHVCALKLVELQDMLLIRARARRDNAYFRVHTLAELATAIEAKLGFYEVSWCGDEACEKSLGVCKVTIRCLLEKVADGRCFSCGNLAKYTVVTARAY